MTVGAASWQVRQWHTSSTRWSGTRTAGPIPSTAPSRRAFRAISEALEAARRVAAEQRVAGQTEAIEYEDENGKWHREVASGRDRPDTEVEDSA